jgi:EF-P beta-lysylation protein EpmB
MLQRVHLPRLPTDSWQKALSDAVRDPAELLSLLELPRDLLPAARKAAQTFPLKVPRSFVARMAKGDPADPLLRQVLPLGAELQTAQHYSTDPVGDLTASPVPGVIHKYHGRVLLVASGACAVHCRYCFRRHFPYQDNHARKNRWQPALDYIASDPSITEIILSGGDPLTLSDQSLQDLLAGLSPISHLLRLRIHTRFGIVLPQRIQPDLVQLLTTSRLQTVVVIHTNHANELNNEVISAMARLKQSGITLLNQTVLLKSINDNPDDLVNLSERLFAAGVLPYYLHILDKVQGAAHFNVDIAAARQLHCSMLARLPGYLVPRLVEERAGYSHKVPLASVS